MLAILNFLNAHNLPILQPILMIRVSKFMVHRALSDKTYLSLGLMSPLIYCVDAYLMLKQTCAVNALIIGIALRHIFTTTVVLHI